MVQRIRNSQLRCKAPRAGNIPDDTIRTSRYQCFGSGALRGSVYLGVGLNLLHLLAAATIAACLYASLPEWQRRRRSRGVLMLAPLLAFIGAFVMIGFSPAEEREPALLRIALAAGLVAGAVRGAYMEVDVDNWGMVRLEEPRDGLAVTMLIAAAVLGATVAPLVFAPAGGLVPYATCVVAAGATFLTGRALAVYVRTRA